MINRFILVAFMVVCLQSTAYAVLDITITEGRESALPIAVGKFHLPAGGDLGTDNPGDIILSDLVRSGYFKATAQLPHGFRSLDDINREYWRGQGANYLVIGQVQPSEAKFIVRYQLIDIYNQSSALRSGEATILRKQMRKYAHTISDTIFSAITGKESSFTSSIAYVLENRNRDKPYSLIFADYDGHNEVEIIKREKAIMSPDISPDKRKIAYVSFEKDRSEIYVQNLYTGQRELIAGEKGINSSPAWSPDGNQLAMVLSLDNNVDIYVYNMLTKKRERITRSPALDTEPFWYDGGKRLLFTSNRGGSPQLYRYERSTRRINRVTFDGRYNASGSFSKNLEQLLMVHRVGRQYQIAVRDEASNTLKVLTKSFNNITPSFSPDGNMILYATKANNRSVLAVMSVDGEYQINLPSPDGDVRDPVWSQ